MTETRLALSYGTSKGRETYGYTIVRLDDLETGKRYRCMGGGYDMVGTVLAEWLQDVHQDRLQEIADQAYYVDRPEGGTLTNESGLYGMRKRNEGGVRVDGACGQSSVEAIAKAIGVTFERTTWDRNGNARAWLARTADDTCDPALCRTGDCDCPSIFDTDDDR